MWQKSNTGMYHNCSCNGAVRRLSGPKLKLEEIPKDAKICKKCLKLHNILVKDIYKQVTQQTEV